MREEDLIAVAEDAGFAKAAVMNTEDLEFEHEFRKFCEQNDCGNYGNNYGCPPPKRWRTELCSTARR